MSFGGEFRVGSGAPTSPGRGPECAATWTGEWEDRAEARPECRREPGHGAEHRAEVTRLDGKCWRYRWTDAGAAYVERC